MQNRALALCSMLAFGLALTACDKKEEPKKDDEKADADKGDKKDEAKKDEKKEDGGW